MTKPDRDAIRARCGAATRGPWVKSYDEIHELDKHGHIGLILFWSRMQWQRNFDADLSFVAHARQDVPALLDALDEAEAEIAALKARDER